MFTTKEAARRAARILQDALQDAGRPMQLTACQALVARSCGYNDWKHLSATVATGNRPGDALDQGRCTERFSAALSVHAPRLPVDAVFVRVFGHASGRGDAERVRCAAEASALARSAGPSSCFGTGLPVFALDRPEREARFRDRSFDLRLPGGRAGSVVLHTAHSSYVENDVAACIHEARACLKVDGCLVAFMQCTLHVPRFAEGVSLADATECADLVSDSDVWSVRNLARAAGPDVFRDGVVVLWCWEVTPSERGGGLGAAFLRAVLAALKASYRKVAVLAVDPATSASRIDFSAAGASLGTVSAASRRLCAYVGSLDLAGSLGPRGRVVTFDNARMGGGWATAALVGEVVLGLDGEGPVPDEVQVAERLGGAFERMHGGRAGLLRAFGLDPDEPG